MNLQITCLVFLKKKRKEKPRTLDVISNSSPHAFFSPPFGCFEGLEVTYYSYVLRFARSIWILVFVLRLAFIVLVFVCTVALSF